MQDFVRFLQLQGVFKMLFIIVQSQKVFTEKFQFAVKVNFIYFWNDNAKIKIE